MSNPLSDLNENEVSRLMEALNSEEGRNLFLEYAQEISDPAMLKQNEDAIRQLEKEAGIKLPSRPKASEPSKSVAFEIKEMGEFKIGDYTISAPVGYKSRLPEYLCVVFKNVDLSSNDLATGFEIKEDEKTLHLLTEKYDQIVKLPYLVNEDHPKAKAKYKRSLKQLRIVLPLSEHQPSEEKAVEFWKKEKERMEAVEMEVPHVVEVEENVSDETKKEVIQVVESQPIYKEEKKSGLRLPSFLKSGASQSLPEVEIVVPSTSVTSHKVQLVKPVASRTEDTLIFTVLVDNSFKNDYFHEIIEKEGGITDVHFFYFLNDKPLAFGIRLDEKLSGVNSTFNEDNKRLTFQVSFVLEHFEREIAYIDDIPCPSIQRIIDIMKDNPTLDGLFTLETLWDLV
ncbi:hypothetical protein PCE1_002538 [Barthelona sp. PCE]